MTNLLWPGDERAGEHMTDQALLRSMVTVESAWLAALSTAGLAPVEGADLVHLVGPNDCEMLAMTAEGGGNPVINLVALLRRRTRSGGRAVDSSRPYQPGCARHQSDAGGSRGGGPGHFATHGTDCGTVGPGPSPPRHADGGADPDAACGADHLRRQGGRLVERCRRRPPAAERAGYARPDRRCRRNMVGNNRIGEARRRGRPGSGGRRRGAQRCNQVGPASPVTVAHHANTGH